MLIAVYVLHAGIMQYVLFKQQLILCFILLQIRVKGPLQDVMGEMKILHT